MVRIGTSSNISSVRNYNKTVHCCFDFGPAFFLFSVKFLYEFVSRWVWDSRHKTITNRKNFHLMRVVLVCLSSNTHFWQASFSVFLYLKSYNYYCKRALASMLLLIILEQIIGTHLCQDCHYNFKVSIDRQRKSTLIWSWLSVSFKIYHLLILCQEKKWTIQVEVNTNNGRTKRFQFGLFLQRHTQTMEICLWKAQRCDPC